MKKFFAVLLAGTVITLLAGCDMNMFQPKKPVAKSDDKPVTQPAQAKKTPATVKAEPQTSTDQPEPSDAMPAPQTGAATSGASEVEFMVENVRPVMATVNGKPIYMEKLSEALVSDYGLPIARQFVCDEVVRQELQRRKISTKTNEQEISDESMRSMRMLFPLEDNITDEQFDSILDQFLRNSGHTRRQWNQTMARNVLLARLLEKDISVSDAELQDAFFRKYDGKYTARLIQVNSLDKAQEILKTLKDEKADFATLAQKESVNPTAKSGGLFEVGARTAPEWVPPAIIEVIRKMKVGEVSEPVMAGATFHIIKLESQTQPQDVKFEDVKAELLPLVKEAKLQQARQKYLADLMKNAKIEFSDPTLRAQNEQRTQKAQNPEE